MGEATFLALLTHNIVTKADLAALRAQNKFSEIENEIIDMIIDL
jgi:hypothetical protein